MFTKIGIGLAVLGVVSFGVSLRFIHPRYRHRGVTEEEVHRPLPGDDQVPDPVVIATRAITIDAPPEQVWPELVQIGEGHTRLITRMRYAFSPGVSRLWRPLIKGVHMLLQSRILRRIKHRVEESRSAGQRKGVLPFGNKEGQSVNDPARESSSVWGFFLLTYAMMLCTWGVMALFQLKGVSSLPNAPKPSPGELFLFLLGGCSPSLAGILMTWRVGERSGLRALWRRAIWFKLGWKWYVVTLLPLFAALLLVGVYLLEGGVLKETAPIFPFLSLMSFTLGIFVFGPLTEECGWRGFALDRLLARWDPLGASLVLGLLWAFWHVPLYFIPNSIQQQSGMVQFPVFLVSIMSKAVLMTWVYLATHHSFWSAIWFHFTSNYAETLLIALTGGAKVYRLLLNGLFAAMAAMVALNWYRRTPARALVH